MHNFHKHLEWIVFAGGLILLAAMSPEDAGTSLCLFEWAGFEFCPGEGLGHSISFTFRGEWTSALNAHFAGPAAVLLLISRILYLWKTIYKESKSKNEEYYG